MDKKEQIYMKLDTLARLIEKREEERTDLYYKFKNNIRTLDTIVGEIMDLNSRIDALKKAEAATYQLLGFIVREGE